MHCSTTTNTTTLSNTKMHSLKPFTFTLNLLLLLLTLSCQKPLVDADIEQLTLHDQSSLSHNNNNNSFASESDEEDILKRSVTIESDIIATNFTYLMKFGLKSYEGETRYKYVSATPDTGSDLIWFHSKPCKCLLASDCYSFLDIEKPKETIGCEKQQCKELKNIEIKNTCEPQNDEKLCWYDGVKYADGTKSEGFFSYSYFQFTIGEGVNNRKLRVGFSTTTKDESVPERNGLVGLGMGDLSFINQYERISKKFSYYLPQFRRKDEQVMKDRSKFKFGSAVEISVHQSTPLFKNLNKYDTCDTRYCIELKSICLKFKDENCENHKIKVSKNDAYNDKVIVVDSGSTFTFLKNPIFKQLLEKVKEKLDDKSPKHILGYKNCFEKKDGNVEKLENISFEFIGTTIELKRENFFDEYSFPADCNGGDQKTYVCLTVEGENKEYHKRLRSYGKYSKVKPQILGSRAQMDFLVAFDLRNNNKKVSFENLEKLPDSGSVEKVSLENNEKTVLSE